MSLAKIRKALRETPEGEKIEARYFPNGSDKVSMGLPTLRWRSKLNDGSLGYGVLSIDGDGEHSGAMAAAALTVLKASYQHVEVLGAADAAKKLGLKKGQALPDGFYVISGSGKIAAGLFAFEPEGSSFGAEKNPGAEAFEALCAKGGVLAGKIEPGAFCSDMRFDVDKLFENPRNFALSLTKNASAGAVYGELGFGARSKILGADGEWGYPNRGYPAFADMGSASHGRLDSADNYEISFLKCLGLPIHNHKGYSLINNVRSLLWASERSSERVEIFESLMDKWMEARLTKTNLRDDVLIRSAGLDDEDGDFWQSPEGVRHLKALRKKAVESGRKSSIGSERQLVCNPNCTSFFNDGDKKLIGSLDFALVDGQHSSVDYAILASAVEVQARGGDIEEWLGHGRGAGDSDPAKLRESFDKAYPNLAKAKGMDARALSMDQKEELWQDFASFCGQATTTVRVTMEANPSNQVAKVNEANNRRPQKKEAMAMLGRKDEIAEFIDLVNEECMIRGNPTMLVQTKSLVSNPDFAGEASAHVVEFESLFPYIYAVSKNYDASQERARKSNLFYGAGEEGDAEIKRQLSKALGVRLNSPKMADLAERARALVDFVGKFKSREYKVAESTLSAFLGKPAGQESGQGKDKESDEGSLNSIARLVGSVQANGKGEKGNVSYNKDGFIDIALEQSKAYRAKWGKRFDDFASFVKDKVRMLAVGDSEYELSRQTRSKIAYEMFERALLIHQELQAASGLNSIMSADLAENVMISVARATGKKTFGAAGGESAQEIGFAIGRVRDLVEKGCADSTNNFNSSREILAAIIKPHEAKEKKYQDELRPLSEAAKKEYIKAMPKPKFDLSDMDPASLALLIDAMPCGKQSESLAADVAKSMAKNPPVPEKGQEAESPSIKGKLGKRRGDGDGARATFRNK